MTEIILAHSEITNKIYALIGKEKVDITEQAIAEVKAIKALSQEPCDDVVSRQAILDGIEELKKSPWATANRSHGYEYLITEALDVVKDLCIKQLPSVKPQKSGKWDRLYSWLNDMRLSIAPDETVTDIDEQHCRESQTDILDEIMEWIEKHTNCGAKMVEPQESEDKE